MIRLVIVSFLLCFALALAHFSFGRRAVAADGLRESCRKEHLTAYGYFDTLKAFEVKIIRVDDGVVYASFIEGSDITAFAPVLTDESIYPREILKPDDDRVWLLIWCEEHKTVYRIERIK